MGRHCESGDVIHDILLAAPRVGDLLAVPVTGAYRFTMANNYNGCRRIPVVFVGNGEARLVVRRETWDDLLARDIDQDSTQPGCSRWPSGGRRAKAAALPRWTTQTGSLQAERGIAFGPPWWSLLPTCTPT